MSLVNQPSGVGTVRKVQFSAGAAAFAAPAAVMISYFLAGLVVDFVPVWQSEQAYLSLAYVIEMLLTGVLTGAGTWAAGYWAKARVTEDGQ